MSARSRGVEKVDFKAKQPELYRASRKAQEIRVPRGAYLTIDGVGAPGGEAYHEAMGQLFALTYTAKFALKGAGILDFTVPALECLWTGPMDTPRDQWQWRLMLRIPEEVTARDLQPVRKALLEKKGLDTSRVKRIRWTEGRAMQMLHVGPYEKLGQAYEALAEAVAGRGFVGSGAAHEVYLNDPRRVAPEKIKTIVRMGVKQA